MSKLDRQIAVEIERSLSSAHSSLVDISNHLFEVAPDHPFLDELSSVITSVEFLPTEDLLEEYQPVEDPS